MKTLEENNAPSALTSTVSELPFLRGIIRTKAIEGQLTQFHRFRKWVVAKASHSVWI